MTLKHLFMEKLIERIQQSKIMQFILPHQIADHYGPVAPITATEPICWVNNFSSNYYPGNELQVEAIKQIYLLQPLVEKVDDLNLLKDWQYLQTSDIIHLMDEQHPMYREEHENRIYNTRYDAYANFMNILDDFRLKVHKELSLKEKTIQGRPFRTGSSRGKSMKGSNKFHNRE